MGRKPKSKDQKDQGSPKDPETLRLEKEADEYFKPGVVNGSFRCCSRKSNCTCGYSFRDGPRYAKVCPVCGKDRRCMKYAKNSQNGRCRKHGGNLGRGLAAPAFKTGKHSPVVQSIPEEYREAYLRVRHSPELIDNADAIAILYARWEEQIRGLSDGENKATIKLLRKLWSELQAASRAAVKAKESGDTEAAAIAQKAFTDTMAALGKAITGAANKMEAWEDWKETTKEISSLRLDQAKLKDFSVRYMATEQAMEMVAFLRNAVLGVLDRKRHAAEIAAIVGKLDEFYAQTSGTEEESITGSGPVSGLIQGSVVSRESEGDDEQQ